MLQRPLAGRKVNNKLGRNYAFPLWSARALNYSTRERNGHENDSNHSREQPGESRARVREQSFAGRGCSCFCCNCALIKCSISLGGSLNVPLYNSSSSGGLKLGVVVFGFQDEVSLLAALERSRQCGIVLACSSKYGLDCGGTSGWPATQWRAASFQSAFCLTNPKLQGTGQAKWAGSRERSRGVCVCAYA